MGVLTTNFCGKDNLEMTEIFNEGTRPDLSGALRRGGSGNGGRKCAPKKLFHIRRSQKGAQIKKTGTKNLSYHRLSPSGRHCPIFAL